MRIIVNDIVAVPNSGGVYSVLQDFYSEVLKFSKSNKDIEWIFLLSGNYVKETDNIKVITLPDIKKSWIKRLKFEFFSGSRFINKLGPDIYFSLQNVMTLGVHARKWVYMHQPLPFQKEYDFSFWKKRERKLWAYQHLVGRVIRFTLKHTDTKIIVQTNWVRETLIDEGVADASKVTIKKPNNINIQLDLKNKIDNTKFFFPATAMVYKNHKVLFEAARELEKKGYHFKIYCTISKKDLDYLGLKPVKSIVLLGIIPREKVINLYQSSILIFPSLIETFGLPLLEAQMANDFILAGDTTFGNEILKNYPNKILFNPYDTDDVVRCMIKCLNGQFDLKKKNKANETSGKSLVKLLLESVGK